MQKIVENHTNKSGIYHKKGTQKNGTTPYHGQAKLPPPPWAYSTLSNMIASSYMNSLNVRTKGI